MPVTTIQIQIIISVVVALLAWFYLDADPSEQSAFVNDPRLRSQAIGDVPARDIYSEIYGTVYFKHYTGITEQLFDFICSRLEEEISEARNYNLRLDLLFNKTRRRRKCKISNKNRIINWLHQMRTGQIIWDAAQEHGWNIYSASQDFFHVLYHFVRLFDGDWIREMSDDQKNGLKGRVVQYPNSYQSLDGTQMLTTKSKKLPDGMRRREVYCWKHRWPQGKNVQAVVSHFGHATEVLIGTFIQFPSICDLNLYIHLIQTTSNISANDKICDQVLVQCLILQCLIQCV